jgi:PEP-CTERM motif
MKILTINSNQTKITSLAAAVALLGLGAICAQGQSVLYNFADDTSDGWANAGFSGSPLATVSTIGGQNYIFLPLGGFQVGNVGAGSGSLFNAMQAAAANPAGYDISYNYYINTATFSGATFLQFGTFVNTGSGYYAQDYGSPNEVQLSGAQIASGGIFQGTVTINMAAVGFNMPVDTFYRLGFVENADSTSTGVGVYVTDISVSPVPEPSSLALVGLGAMGCLLMLRRRLV